MLLFGWAFYVPIYGNLTTAYHFHFDMIFAINNPFASGTPPAAQVIGAIDTSSSVILVPSLIGVLLQRFTDLESSLTDLKGREIDTLDTLLATPPPGSQHKAVAPSPVDFDRVKKASDELDRER
jgi:hypothetical protein